MAKSFLEPHCTHRLPSSSSSILNSPFPKLSPTKSQFANASRFSTRIPNHFRARPISFTPTKSFSFKAFSSQIPTSAPKHEMPARVGFLGIGIMGSPMAQNLIKAGYVDVPQLMMPLLDWHQFQALKGHQKMDN